MDFYFGVYSIKTKLFFQIRGIRKQGMAVMPVEGPNAKG